MSALPHEAGAIAGLASFRRSWGGPLLLALALAAAAYTAQRLTAAFAERGATTGFGFLSREAGFAIGEVIPLPLLEGGGATFVALLLFAGALAALLRLLVPPARAGRRWTLGLTLVAIACLLGALAGLVGGDVRLTGVSYAPERSFAFALATGFANTLKVALVGCLLATVVGVLVGIGRLSTNLLVRSVATAYVEGLRNVPLLIQVFFWYFGVLRALPPVRNSVEFLGIAALNNRGVYLPLPETTPGAPLFLAALAIAVLATILVRREAARVQALTGRRPRTGWLAAALLVGLPATAWLLAGAPLAFSLPVRAGFNYVGGTVITPEYTALLLGISLYAAAFIAEIVRSGIQGVAHGQREAARALGLHDGRTMRLVILPQAVRVIIPPLISQYLSIVKDSSLGIAIAYPELVSVSNTMINQTGQPIEILTITILVFMIVNLVISALINRYNRSLAWSDAR